jgi:hypothetical protein
VAGGDAIAGAVGDGIGEELIAETASFLFGVAFGGGKGGGAEGDAVFCGERLDEGFVRVGFGASQFVIDMEDGGGLAEFVEGGQEEDGIGAAGDGYSDSIVASRFKLGKDGSDLFDHILMLAAALAPGAAWHIAALPHKCFADCATTMMKL